MNYISKIDGLNDEILIALGFVILSGFIAINVSTTVGLIYGIFAIAYFVQVAAPRVPEVQVIAPRENFAKSAILGLVFFLVWIFLSAALTGYFHSESLVSSAGDFLVKLKSETQIPVLSNDPMAVFVIYGQAIPIIESLMFLSVVLIFWVLAFKVQPDSISSYKDPRFKKLIVAAILVGVVGSLFHASVRVLSDFALVIDFLFFTMSALGVILTKKLFKLEKLSMLSMIVFHILVNTAVLLVK